MSRLGKRLISVPKGVEITLTADSVTVKGPKGELHFPLSAYVTVTQADSVLKVRQKGDDSRASSFQGLTRMMLSNMIQGVTSGFERKLEITGVGFRAQVSGQKITLNLGFSHPIVFEAPKGVKLEMDKEQKNIIIVSGIDKQAVGQAAANIRGYKPPEPYKGKGIHYLGEHIVRKAGKAAAGSKE
ncbi:50S ribosomal protein L6 [Candidatus Peregrinibacteria bacterium]|nr:50S ribosomal protein L6 [Candidatus Peregrinibacteria bacterium]